MNKSRLPSLSPHHAAYRALTSLARPSAPQLCTSATTATNFASACPTVSSQHHALTAHSLSWRSHFSQCQPAASSIEKLPAELLKWILLEAVSDINPPIYHTEHGVNRLRRREQCEDRQPTASDFLGSRLVCSRFRDAAWRVFAKVIGETVYDIGSSDSIQNLCAVPGQPDVVPWVKKLNLSCNILNRCDTEDLQLAPDAATKLKEVRCCEQKWTPNVLDAADTHLNLYMRTRLETDSVHELYAAQLQEALLPLKNVEQISYIWDGGILPQRQGGMAA